MRALRSYLALGHANRVAVLSHCSVLLSHKTWRQSLHKYLGISRRVHSSAALTMVTECALCARYRPCVILLVPQENPILIPILQMKKQKQERLRDLGTAQRKHRSGRPPTDCGSLDPAMLETMRLLRDEEILFLFQLPGSV